MDEIELNPIGLIDRAALEFLKSKSCCPALITKTICGCMSMRWLFKSSKMLDQDLLAEVKTALEGAVTSARVISMRLKSV